MLAHRLGFSRGPTRRPLSLSHGRRPVLLRASILLTGAVAHACHVFGTMPNRAAVQPSPASRRTLLQWHPLTRRRLQPPKVTSPKAIPCPARPVPSPRAIVILVGSH
ncbi:hypothetical protein E2562_012443 [Oryza meyeriana var. granulata]|uniref:Uncharacterized protein n=1 Tax=Oryza meyeriana var. granulata TaxID=110450 RepID=A0A6G1C448_9ORYZ|nr:hypothetical protein E2562_012443 [Oryza meyeriana var. granulata]